MIKPLHPGPHPDTPCAPWLRLEEPRQNLNHLLEGRSIDGQSTPAPPGQLHESRRRALREDGAFAVDHLGGDEHLLCAGEGPA